MKKETYYAVYTEDIEKPYALFFLKSDAVYFVQYMEGCGIDTELKEIEISV